MTRKAVLTLGLIAALAVVGGAGAAHAESADGIMRLSVVFTNDIHGGIDPSGATFMNREFPPPLGGGASAATYVAWLRERAKEEGGHVLLFDQGDIFQGTPVGNYRKGEAIIEYFNHIGLDLWTIGNHDFDEGSENLRHLVEMSQMPVLSANITWADTGEPIEGIVPYVIREYDGIKIAIIGLTTTDTPKMAFPDHVKGIAFKPEVETLEKYVREVREKGADLVFVTGHFGLPYDPVTAYREMIEAEEGTAEGAPEPAEQGSWGPTVMDVAHKVPGIDVIFGGHIHKGFDKAWEEPSTHTLAFQTYGRGTGLGHIDLLIDRKNKTILGYELADYRGGLITLFEDEWWPDSETSTMIGEMVAEAEQGMDEVIGVTEVDLTRGGEGETRMGNLVCNAMLEEAAADFAFSNLGGIRDEIPAGPVTPRQVFGVLPFGNRLTILEVDGRLLKEILEYRVSAEHHGLYIAGGRLVYSKIRPDYDRLTKLEIGGEPWSPDRTYRIVTTDFLAAGNAGLYMLPAVPIDKKITTSTTDMEAVVRYIRRHTPINVTTDGRWVRDDNAGVDPALAEAMEGMEPIVPPTGVDTGGSE
jgi:5'-nucleotidase/UDP-sugar diphosphatase